MAETHRDKRSQHAHASNSLNYGNLGTATYSEPSQAWTFLRKNIASRQVKDVDYDQPTSNPVFPFRLIEEHTKTVVDSDSPEVDSSGTSFTSNGFNPFLKHLPDVVPAMAQNLREQFFSPSLAEDAKTPGPNLSGRLAFGSAVGLSEREEKSIGVYVPITACAAGSNAELVKLVRIGRERVILNRLEHKKDNFLVPCISKQDEAWWTGSGEPVQQICFAAAHGPPSTWMAVRQPSGTTLLHPLLHRRPVPARYSQEGKRSSSHPASSLDANPALTIPMSRTGGFPHADMSYHPQDHRIIAIVDEHGNWSIWRLEGTQSITTRILFRVHLQCSGKVYSWQSTRRPADIDPYYDGWHRLQWLGRSTHTSDRLLVCNRQIATMYNDIGGLVGFVNMCMGPIGEGQWILDVKKSAAHQGHCFVLTSTRLLLMSAADENRTDPDDEGAMSMIFSWQHFRSRADSTMRLTLAESPQSCTVFIYSKSNVIVTAFRIGTDFGTSSSQVSLVDPEQVLLPRGDPRRGHGSLNVDYVFRDLQIRHMLDNLVHHVDLTLFKLFIQGGDLTITEALFQCTDHDLMKTFDISFSNTIPLPVGRTLRQRSGRYAEVDEVEDFIVEHEQPDFLSPEKTVHCEASRAGEQMHIVPTGASTHWEDNYGIIVLADDRIARARQVEVPESLRRIRRRLQNMTDSGLPLILFLEAARKTPFIPDVEDASTALSSFLQSISEEVARKADLINLRAPYEPSGQSSTLLQRYNTIFEAWVTPLPPQIPDRVRVNRERLARVVAAELALAATAMRNMFETPKRTRDNALQSQSAFRDSGSAEHEPASSQPGSLPATTQEYETCLARLRSLVSFEKSNAPILAASALTDMLAHLPASISISPATYSWRKAETSLAAAREEHAASQLDPKARRRTEKRAEIRRRKLEAQKKLSQTLLAERLSAMPRVMDTQISIELPVREAQSSQLAPPESSQGQGGLGWPRVSMTQPERGVFGVHNQVMAGRKGKGKGKQVRKAGF